MAPFVSISILFDFRWGAFAPFNQEIFENDQNGNDLSYDDGMFRQIADIAFFLYIIFVIKILSA